MKNYFQLFSNCITVFGYNRSIVCDLQRGKFEFIPNSLAEIIKDKIYIDIDKIKNKFNDSEKEIIDEYFDFLAHSEFGFWANEPNDNLIGIKTEWTSFAHITNCLIDVDKFSDFSFFEINRQLDELNCIALEIRFFDIAELTKIEEILKNFQMSKLRSIDLVMQQNEELNLTNLQKLITNNLRISTIYVSNSEIEENVVFNSTSIVYSKDIINSEKHCGLISSKFFAINLDAFTESINHNSCLNRKISIDKDGNIKNCPSMKETYGNMNDISLETALNHPNFKKHWDISKDQINVCKDCEFRHICTDCRAFIEEPDNLYSKPLKCGYNPYTNVWEEWSANPLKQKTIKQYSIS